MKADKFRQLAARLMQHPAAPYFEHSVRAEVEAVCAEHGLRCERDRFGNLLISLRTGRGLRPLVLAAHLDHPGFEVLRRLGPARWLARFRGSVPEKYFKSGVLVRLMPGSARGEIRAKKQRGRMRLEIRAASSSDSRFKFAVWDLEDFSFRKGQIHGRSCDDLLGVAAVLATLIDLKEARAKVHVVGVLSRAEEVGFHGALALAADSAKGAPAGPSRRKRNTEKQPRSPRLAADSFVISLETSRELPGSRMGAGVIIRVGDKASVFDSEATRYITEVATYLKERNPDFGFQRALMSGGTCEATAYQEFGFQSAAVCVALGNYHNCGPSEKIRAEYVSLADAWGMVELLAECARRMPQYKGLAGKLPARLGKLLAEARTGLPRSA